MGADPLQAGSQTNQIVLDIRKRKGEGSGGFGPCCFHLCFQPLLETLYHTFALKLDQFLLQGSSQNPRHSANMRTSESDGSGWDGRIGIPRAGAISPFSLPGSHHPRSLWLSSPF